MSNPTDKPPVITDLAPAAEPTDDVATKRSFVQRRIVDPIKTHPKIAIAVAAGAGLVASAALAGRKSAHYDVVLELTPAEPVDVEPIVVLDTSSTPDE